MAVRGWPVAISSSSSWNISWLLLAWLCVSCGQGYIYRFSITQPYAPDYVQYSEVAVGSLPFGFSDQGRVAVRWWPWAANEWNATGSVGSSPFGGFFVDHAGHWRPPVSWSPSQAPGALSVGWCRVEVCLPPLRGTLSPIGALLGAGQLSRVATWNTSESFSGVWAVPRGHSVVVVWAEGHTSHFTSDLVELEHLELTLSNSGDLEGGDTHLALGQLGLPEMYAAFTAIWGFALCAALANQWLRRRVSSSRHVWYLLVLLAVRLIQLLWSCALWWTLQVQGYLYGYAVLFASFGQVVDFWLRLTWTVGACVLALDAPILATAKPARTVLVWMLLVALVAAFASVTFADLTWWLWGAMLIWSDVAFQAAFTVSLVWLFRLDAARLETSGKRPKFADKNRCCWGAFSLTTSLPMAYVKLLVVADTIRASPVWYRGDYLAHFALVEVSHALFAVWLFLVVTARVARDDLRARAFIPLSEREMGVAATATTTDPSTDPSTTTDPSSDVEMQPLDPDDPPQPSAHDGADGATAASPDVAVSVSRPSDFGAL